MRDLLIFGIVFGILPFILKRPAVGVLLYACLSLMNPHRLTYGPAYDFPFAALVALITLVGILASREKKHLALSGISVLLISFFAWTTFTTFFALEPDQAWEVWGKVIKTFFMVLVTMYVIRSEKDIKLLAGVIGFSLGFYGLKGGIFTIASGGVNRVMGPYGSYIADNNDLALALIIAVPIIWFFSNQLTIKPLRACSFAIVALTIIGAVGTYSRGALLAGIAMLFFLWLKSSAKIRTGLILLLIIPIVLTLMPNEWHSRMASIGNYESDASAQGRFNAWFFAFNVANVHFLGGGFNVFTPRLFEVYAPVPLDFHAAHSIYFRVLGEHGYIGLIIFSILLAVSWRTASNNIRICIGQKELAWASNLSAMCQVSIVGYAVGGAFLSLSYYDFYFYVIAIIYLINTLLNKRNIKFPQLTENQMYDSPKRKIIGLSREK